MIAGIDETKIEAWLAALPVQARSPLMLKLIGQGKSNITAEVRDPGGRRWVLRRPPLGSLLASAHDVEREYTILEALQPTPVPVPRTIALTKDVAVTDAPLLLMEHVDGLVVDVMSTAEALSPRFRRVLATGMVDALARIHAVDLERTKLGNLASPKPFAQRQLTRWRTQWEASRTRDLPVVDELADRLAAAAPVSEERTLVHGDFHLRNVIADPVSGKLRAVLDWELATLGDPLADLGGLLAYWPEAGDPAGESFAASALPGFPTRAELRRLYADATGRDLSSLPFWEALGLWKLAVIGEGVRRRALDDPRNAERGAVIAESMIDAVIARAMSTANGAGL